MRAISPFASPALRSALRAPAAVLIAAALLSAACEEEPPIEPVPNPEAVAETATWDLPCLTAPVHVVFTEFGVPHIYGETRADVACAQGFVTARDRFFQMDLISRNGLGTLAELLGEAGIETDIEVRARGTRGIAEQMLASNSSQMNAVWEAYAGGVNAYIDLARAGRLEPPPEFEVAAIFLGASDPTELLVDWTPLNIGGVAATVNFVSGFETTDIGNQAKEEALETWGVGLPDETLRRAGARFDVWENIVPPYALDSAPGFGEEGRDVGPTEQRRRMRSGPKVESGVLARAVELSERMDQRIARDAEGPWGSNSWAVSPELSANGKTLLASDGHLALTIPSFLWNLHIDTQLLGGGDLHMLGMTVAGAPMVGLGTNGDVAWGHTSQVSDINDYYRDLVDVDDSTGRPVATFFQGDWQPLEEIDETYEVSGALGGTKGTRTISRWISAQGRPVFSLEGTVVGGPEDLPEDMDAAAVNIFGNWIIAGDVDGDGDVTAITGAATHFSERHMIEHVDGWARANDVDEWHRHLGGMTSYSQHFIAADSSGNILYSGFQAMPCRGYLPRDADGVPEPGANPQLLIDGTVYPSFTVAYDDDGFIATNADDPLLCTIAQAEYPHAKNPAQGWVNNSNNAPWGAATDNNIWNEDRYFGGPWYGTWRGSRIAELLEESAGQHSLETMATMHGDHKSRLATEFLPALLESLDHVSDLAANGATEEWDVRTLALYDANQARIDEAWMRLQTWTDRGLITHSGVDTFYSAPTADEMGDAVATMIWNAWFGRFMGSVWNDEALPGIFRPTGSFGRTRAMKTIIDGVGPVGADLASMHPDRGESVFFDVVSTPEIESRHELAIRDLVATLDYLATPFGGDRSGGFNTDDMDQWLWGLKHFVHFDNFVAREIGDDPIIAGLFSDIQVTPEVLPLDDPEPPFGDPRRGLPGFPRPGDTFAIDAAGGISTTDFSYGSGPVMRMAFELGPDGMEGINVIPGGQSADPDSEHFADQAALWIANETWPVRFYVDDVIANATGREVLRP